jgi:hypothetical protein
VKKIKTTRLYAGAYSIKTGGMSFQATRLDLMYDDVSLHQGAGWRLMIVRDDGEQSWANDFATRWQCKEAAAAIAADA